MLPRFAALALLLPLLSAVSAYPSGHGHEHPHGLANGQSCNQSIQCESQYCRRGFCDVKKPNGSKCYKDAGCLSGKCDHSRCRAVGHSRPTVTPTTSPCPTSSSHTSLYTSSTPKVTIVTTSSTTKSASSTTTPTTTATPTTTVAPTIITSTITPTTTATTSTPTTTSTTTTSTPPPAPTFGDLTYSGFAAYGSSGADRNGYIVEDTAFGGITTGTTAGTQWRIDARGYLVTTDNYALYQYSGLFVLRGPDDAPGDENGYPYVCYFTEGTTDRTPTGETSNTIFCEVQDRTYNMYVCSSGKLQPALSSCGPSDDSNQDNTVFGLAISG